MKLSLFLEMVFVLHRSMQYNENESLLPGGAEALCFDTVFCLLRLDTMGVTIFEDQRQGH